MQHGQTVDALPERAKGRALAHRGHQEQAEGMIVLEEVRGRGDQ
jgi:hypothetical protein